MKFYISSEQSKDLFPQNTPSNFRVKLPKYIEIANDSCAIHSCILPTRPSQPVFLKCDIVQPSLLFHEYHPVLCQLNSKTTVFHHPHYIPMKPGSYNIIHLQLVNRAGTVSEIKDGFTIAELHIRNGHSESASATF